MDLDILVRYIGVKAFGSVPDRFLFGTGTPVPQDVEEDRLDPARGRIVWGFSLVVYPSWYKSEDLVCT